MIRITCSVLQSIELQAERGSIPLLARCDDVHSGRFILALYYL